MKTDHFIELAKHLKQDKLPAIYYFCNATKYFSVRCKGLGHAKLNKGKPCGYGKPLGTDLASSVSINDSVAKYFKESQIYRITTLGERNRFKLIGLTCFANSLFVNNWDNKTIDHVQITVAEEVGIEGRWGISIKRVKCVIWYQNHLLQILTMIAMSPPADLTADSIRQEKVKVLRYISRIDMTNVREKTVRGQYTAGFVQGKKYWAI